MPIRITLSVITDWLRIKSVDKDLSIFKISSIWSSHY